MPSMSKPSAVKVILMTLGRAVEFADPLTGIMISLVQFAAAEAAAFARTILGSSMVNATLAEAPPAVWNEGYRLLLLPGRKMLFIE